MSKQVFFPLCTPSIFESKLSFYGVRDISCFCLHWKHPHYQFHAYKAHCVCKLCVRHSHVHISKTKDLKLYNSASLKPALYTPLWNNATQPHHFTNRKQIKKTPLELVWSQNEHDKIVRLFAHFVKYFDPKASMFHNNKWYIDHNDLIRIEN